MFDTFKSKLSDLLTWQQCVAPMLQCCQIAQNFLVLQKRDKCIFFKKANDNKTKLVRRNKHNYSL